MHYFTDMARLGAQVVAGIGFIGAGTIIVSGQQRVKGLTTAAGLWTTAIIGLAFGGGFFEGGLLATLLVLLVELLLTKFEYSVHQSAPEVNIYMEYLEKATLDEVLKYLRDHKVKILKIQIARSSCSKKHNASVYFSLRLNRNCNLSQVLNAIHVTSGVVTVNEL